MNNLVRRFQGMRIELSDQGRLAELCEFFRTVQAVARIEGNQVVVHLPGTPSLDDERHLRAYLDTWLMLAAARGTAVTANVDD